MLQPLTPVEPKTVAFIDLGTNSVRMMMVRINPNHSYTVISQLKEMVRLGGGASPEGRLAAEAMDRAVLVLCQFERMARSNHADRIVAVATAATREAPNRTSFIRRLNKESGLEVQIVSGREEARLIYLGVVNGVELGGRNALIVDIGGGSTEIIVGSRKKHLLLDSLKVGAVRLAGRFLEGESGPVSDKRFDEIKRHVRSAAVQMVRKAKQIEFETAFGTSGAIQNLAEIAEANFPMPQTENGKTVRIESLRQTSRLLRSVAVEERRKVKGINPARADIIVPGAAILETLLEELSVQEMRVCEFGLKDGLLADYLSRSEMGGMMSELGVRERSVIQLGRNCGLDETHHRHVRDLALQLFDSGASNGLHGLTGQDRELLGHAAMLHDVGTFISYSNHHAHSHYVIKNADLLGFAQEELDVLAAAAFFHRKTLASEKYAEFGSLSKKGRESVKALSIFLRLAESLDRSHSGIIESASFSKVEKKSVALVLRAKGECELELWGAKKHMKAFKKTFDLNLVQFRVIDSVERAAR